MINNETHHKPRYEKSFQLCVYFYGNITQAEIDTAKNMVERNSINFNVAKYNVAFFESIEQLCEKIGES